MNVRSLSCAWATKLFGQACSLFASPACLINSISRPGSFSCWNSGLGLALFADFTPTGFPFTIFQNYKEFQTWPLWNKLISCETGQMAINLGKLKCACWMNSSIWSFVFDSIYNKMARLGSGPTCLIKSILKSIPPCEQVCLAVTV